MESNQNNPVEAGSQGKSAEDVAEHLVDTLCLACSEMLGNVAAGRAADAIKAGEAVDRARADLIQALNSHDTLVAALEYIANKGNWDIQEDGSLDMKRPGGFRQEGITMYSAHLKPWILASDALAAARKQVAK